MAEKDAGTPPAQPHAAWARVKALFADAADLPEDRRASWLDEACGGDRALRAEVESLLESDRDAGAFCETPAAAMPGAWVDGIARRLSPGTRLGHYEVLRFIGAGGMGEVYGARDLRTGRDVAIKTVGAATLPGSGEHRLLQEARHAATLAHPNICAIHEIGVADGMPFIAMELVDGETLADVQGREPLPLDRALACGIDVAHALEHAHARGVIHRDLKRSNIVISRDGRAVVLDFGLAKRVAAEGVPLSTESMTATALGLAGTLTHMAPEVLLGARADARADIWAFGVLLYELAAGCLPFSGRTPFETSSAILGDAPKPLPRSLPLALRLVIARCLEKDPARRFQAVTAIREALEAIRRKRAAGVAMRLLAARRSVRRNAAWAALLVLAAGLTAAIGMRASAPPAGTVALLPLAHGRGAGDDVHAAAMTEALVTQLGESTSLRVVSSSSLPGDERSPVDAGRALGADAVVTGALRRTGGGIELELRLIETASGRTRWSSTFARGPRDVLVLQAEAVRSLASGMDAALTARGRDRLTLVPAVRPDVYEAFLQGRYEWNQRTTASLQRAVAHFQQAIALDPAYAPAYARLADCYNLLGTVMIGAGSPLTYRPQAEAAAIKALQIDPDLAEAHAALGYVRHYSWQWADAEQSFLRAIALNPSAPLPRLWYANLLMSRARFDEALRQAETARALDPFSLIVHTNIGWIHYYARRYGAAIETLERAVALDPAYPQARWRLAVALGAARRDADARAHTEEALRLTKRSSSALALAALIAAMGGRTADARSLLAEYEDRARREYVSPGTIAGVHAFLGDRDRAIEWMERSLREQSNAAVYFAVEPWAEPLRGDPRYQTILARVGLDGAPQP